jgi:hypothetical protein
VRGYPSIARAVSCWLLPGDISKLSGLAGGWEMDKAEGVALEPVSNHRHRFLPDIINHAVWLYHVFSFSLRDIELILAERGMVVTRESSRHWCHKFGAELATQLRRRRPRPGDSGPDRPFRVVGPGTISRPRRQAIGKLDRSPVKLERCYRL